MKQETTQQPPKVYTLDNLSGINPKIDPHVGLNIMTMAHLNHEAKSDPTKSISDQRRKIKGTEDEILKKIAYAEAVNKGIVKGPMGSMNRIKDREYVK